MKKLITIILISVLLASCNCTAEHNTGDVIIKIYKETSEKGYCRYFPKYGEEFIDICGKFSIGDTIYLSKNK